MQTCTNKLFRESIKEYRLHACGKTRGNSGIELGSGQEDRSLPEKNKRAFGHLSWRPRDTRKESGDSVERLEGCSGAKDARSGKDGRAARRARTHGRSTGARERACWGVWRAGVQLCVRSRRLAAVCAGAQARGCERGCAATGVLFIREHVLHLK
ncbi:hypothetical protein CRG98_005808 [Punica granatum]|uniref:Uncharacterized protein n=1 Tax=Punica granatum TaxID=22663 RepID=A0A2I0KZC7_PUNGR|nr:hypothetical protein CRG98_005808 [Punica granatum]